MTPPPEIAPITRIQENVLARAERRVLNRLCAAMPKWVTPDKLTALGMVGAVMILCGYLASNANAAWLWLSIAGFILHWLGDSLDGSLARFRKIERPRYGYFLDHSCDGLATAMIVAGIGMSPYVAMDAALLGLAGYLLLSIHAFLTVRVLGELPLTYLNLGPTEVRLILIALTIAFLVFGVPRPVWQGETSFDLIAWGAGLLMIGVFIVQTAGKARLLAKQEPPRA
ncbi:CDP-alcohol phosphatidyltransferase family protein [Qipengyuania sediminis]|uniref:CDP-alcohol phosphatidyltransferase family protein n=1 Tax=Qipengyuania sediminis TaxID=1532023 RepID=UPI00105999E6|nr:CDP-alcohol phosphatidyltransferase family protein [Qipengyuania sediminis]